VLGGLAHVCQGGMAHALQSHCTRMKESWHMYEGVMGSTPMKSITAHVLGGNAHVIKCIIAHVLGGRAQMCQGGIAHVCTHVFLGMAHARKGGPVLECKSSERMPPAFRAEAAREQKAHE